MMDDHLIQKALSKLILNRNMPEDKKNEWKLSNYKATVIIQKYIERRLFQHMSNFDNTYELWTKI